VIRTVQAKVKIHGSGSGTADTGPGSGTTGTKGHICFYPRSRTQPDPKLPR